ncbi:D12 class N6 adenine-specific DNA methyltransferase [Roseibium sp. TrichSKD4]|uniref:DNA adenine methylase n=1 Tax=Roseibium sp. TrichSKD4 TaxID=744980 RepID=UPI0001E569D4|nr:DNA adenine methylase [Roseibium sp. TrichSKD4]EFO32519.1 D12 class N6 adenine-specific DNA methyltransferase [Roseibium sp. TrichSKD4]
MQMLEAVSPVKPVAAYIGGKLQLAKHIAGRISAVDHATYVEPFIGMGGIFFRRSLKPKCEVINDISKDVATLFRILQRHYPQFLDTLKFQLTSRSEFQRLLKTDPDTLTDLERAARFLYLQRISFAGKVQGRTFGVSLRGARFDLTKVEPLLEDVHERLSGVIIEHLAYADCIKRYDRPDTLFYIDPPYWDCETYYGKGVFSKDDFQALAGQLKDIKGRFLMSINDVPEIREIFADFDIEQVTLKYTANAKGVKQAKELVIGN